MTKIKVVSRKTKADTTEKSLSVQSFSEYEMITEWDITKIVDTLTLETSIEKNLAIDIANSVEKKLIKMEQDKISTEFIRSLIDEELTLRGMQRQLVKQKQLSIATYDLEQAIISKTLENSNVRTNTPEAVNMFIAETILKQYAFNRVFSKEVTDSHLTGKIHVHDSSFPIRLYCGSHSIESIKKYGLRLDNLSTVSSPPKNIMALTGQLITFVASIQAYYAGAIGLAYLNTFYAPMCLGLNKEELIQNAQSLIFSLSQCAFSRGSQSLFLDANIDLSCPSFFKNIPAIVSSGKYVVEVITTNHKNDDILKLREKESFRKYHWIYVSDKKNLTKKQAVEYYKSIDKDDKVNEDNIISTRLLTYGDFEKQIQDFAEALMLVWHKGDANGSIFPFPKFQCHIHSGSFTEGTREHDLLMYACEMASDKGITNFVFDKGAISLSQCITIDKPLLFSLEGKLQHDYLPYYKDGWSKINNLKVLGFDGNLQKVDSVFLKQYDGEIYNITLQDGEKFSVTPDHPFLGVLSKNQRQAQKHLSQEVLAKNLKIGDRLQYITPKKIEEGIAYINLYDHNFDDLLELKNGKIRAKRAQSKGVNNKLSLDFDLGRFIGLFMAEGSYDSSKYTSRHRMSFHENEATFIDFCSKIINKFGTTVTVRHYPKLKIKSVEFSSNLIHVVLKTFIGGNLAKDKYFKDICLSTTSDFREGLVSGLMDGDGHFLKKIGKTIDVGIHVASKSLTESTKVLLSSLGIRTTAIRAGVCNNHRNKDKKCYSYTIRICNADVSKLKAQYISKLDNRVTTSDFRTIYNNGIVVTNIEKAHYSGLVYNFEMNKIHEYSLFGVRSKNCCRLKETITDMSLIENPETLRFVGFQNVSVNLPQCAMRAKGSIEKTIEELKKTMDICMKAHLQKKKYIQSIMDNPSAPLYQVGKPYFDGAPYVNLDKSTYIIGLIGLNECVQRITGKQLHEDDESYKLGIKLITTMYLYTKKLTKEFGLKVVLEETPGESTNARLAKIDIKRFDEAKDIIKGNQKSGDVYYTNSVHITADANISIIERIEKQSKFSQLIDAGSITHVFLGEQTPPKESIFALIKKTFDNTHCSQLTISPELVVCTDCGHIHHGFDGYID